MQAASTAYGTLVAGNDLTAVLRVGIVWPAVVVNECTCPSFENGAPGWSVSGNTPLPTFAPDTGQAFMGTHSLKITWAANASVFQGPCITLTGLSTGEQYTASAQVYTPTGG